MPMISVAGFGHHVPEGVLSNAALEAEFGLEPGWIPSVSGILRRRCISEGETILDLAHAAAQGALADAGMEADRLGAILVGTGTPPRQFPGLSADLQQRLGVQNIPAFDIHLASVGGLFAMGVAVDLCPRYGPVLVVGAEVMSAVMARPPRVKETAILFGDGAGACVVGPGPGKFEVVDVRLRSDSTLASELRLDFAAPLSMNGRAVILQANRKLQGVILELLSGNGLGVADVERFLFHQANLNLLKQVGQSLKIPEERVFVNLQDYGNTSAASVLIAASESLRRAPLRPGAHVVLAAFGAGMSWGGLLLRAGGSR